MMPAAPERTAVKKTRMLMDGHTEHKTALFSWVSKAVQAIVMIEEVFGGKTGKVTIISNFVSIVKHIPNLNN